jgi:hypothetical protein
VKYYKVKNSLVRFQKIYLKNSSKQCPCCSGKFSDRRIGSCQRAFEVEVGAPGGNKWDPKTGRRPPQKGHLLLTRAKGRLRGKK